MDASTIGPARIPARIKLVVFGQRHTGQGPLGRAWGHTGADLPDLQPVVIYEREAELDGSPVIVEAWILSLDHRFAYMRQAMYRHAGAFLCTFEATELRAKALDQLACLDPFLQEIDAMTPERDAPRLLVATWMDPTLPRVPVSGVDHVRAWMERNRVGTCVEVDMNGTDVFQASVDRAVLVAARLARGWRETTRRPGS